MSTLCVGIAIGGICLIHIVVAIGGLHHGGIVHIGEVPLPAVAPACDIHIVVGIFRSPVMGKLLLHGPFGSSDHHIFRIYDSTFILVHERPDMIFPARCEIRKSHLDGVARHGGVIHAAIDGRVRIGRDHIACFRVVRISLHVEKTGQGGVGAS